MPCLRENENDAKMRARLLDSLSRSFPSSALSKALHMDCDENLDPFSSSCFANIRLEKLNVKDEFDDDELTSLAWLQDANLLKNITPDSKCMSPIPKRDFVTSGFDTPFSTLAYDPVVHVKHKPPYSFTCMIFMAIESSPTKCLPVKGIYDWIVKTFPFFRTASTGWRNSVRHNLSMSKCFVKVERDHHQNLGKGSSWTIDPLHRPNLLQALKRMPYHPFQQLQIISSSNNSQNGNKSTDDTEHLNSLKQFTDLFPFLSKQLLNAKCIGQKENRVNNSGNISVANESEQQRQFTSSFGFGSSRERVIQNLRSRKDLSDIVCTPCPMDDHSYSISVCMVKEARAGSQDISEDEMETESEWESEESMVETSDLPHDCVSDGASLSGRSLGRDEAVPKKKKVPTATLR